jgi:Cu(I)/Ag(I) efflux system membrane protein CusA/SilA
MVIFLFLYITFKRVQEALLVMLAVPFALIGGIYLLYFMDVNFSVAVWVGFIALFGVAVETGVVMVLYLQEALDKRIRRGNVSRADVFQACLEGSLLRLRPKLMTVGTTLFGLTPILWSTGTGSDVMQPIAIPMVGGMVTSAVAVLIVTPVLFAMLKVYELKRGTLKEAGVAH